MMSPNVSVAVSDPTVTVSVAVVVPGPAVVKLKGLVTPELWLRSLYVQVTVEFVPDVTVAHARESVALVNVKYALS
jgi:hypothetical protein